MSFYFLPQKFDFIELFRDSALHRHTQTFRSEIVKVNFFLHSLLKNLDSSNFLFIFADAKQMLNP